MKSMTTAHWIVRQALRSGDLVAMPCAECGDEAAVAHHDDYAYPLEVRWLCHSHHRRWHAANGPGLNKPTSEDLITFKLPAHEKAALERIAAEDERTVSAVLRLLIRDLLERRAA